MNEKIINKFIYNVENNKKNIISFLNNIKNNKINKKYLSNKKEIDKFIKEIQNNKEYNKYLYETNFKYYNNIITLLSFDKISIKIKR